MDEAGPIIALFIIGIVIVLGWIVLSTAIICFTAWMPAVCVVGLGMIAYCRIIVPKQLQLDIALSYIQVADENGSISISINNIFYTNLLKSFRIITFLLILVGFCIAAIRLQYLSIAQYSRMNILGDKISVESAEILAYCFSFTIVLLVALIMGAMLKFKSGIKDRIENFIIQIKHHSQGFEIVGIANQIKLLGLDVGVHIEIKPSDDSKLGGIRPRPILFALLLQLETRN